MKKRLQKFCVKWKEFNSSKQCAEYKSARGITLIALIVTIIVLLILAGVSLNLVAGSDGIINKASNAVSETKKATIKEEVELLIAELQMDYYEDYANNKANYSTALDYAKAQLQTGSKQTGSGVTITYTAPKYFYERTEFTIDTNGNVTVGEQTGNAGGTTTPPPSATATEAPSPTVTPEPKYTITYNANGGETTPESETNLVSGAVVTLPTLTRDGYSFLGWATSQSATSEEFKETYTITGNVTLYAVWQRKTSGALTEIILEDNYGDPVNYSITVNGVTLDKWKIFYNDGTNVIIKMADYLPNSTGIAEAAGFTISDYEEEDYDAGKYYDYSKYGVYSSLGREDLITKLNDTSKWSGLVTPELRTKGVTAKGGVDLETWVASWNAYEGNTKLYTKYNTDTSGSLKEGYLIGTDNPPTTTNKNVSNSPGYNDTMYFPYKDWRLEGDYGCSAYWLASTSAYNTNYVLSVGFGGGVTSYASDINSFGVSPAVYLTSNILGEKVDGVWNIN